MRPIFIAAILIIAVTTAFRVAVDKDAEPELIVHEWVTFTTVAGSDGVLLPGLQREEERLPYFVYSHGQRPSYGNKGIPTMLHNVTVRMETPVLYFYSPTAVSNVGVNVDFKGGSISEWFPQRSAGEELGALRGVDFAKGFNGSIQWQVDVMASAPSGKRSFCGSHGTYSKFAEAPLRSGSRSLPAGQAPRRSPLLGS